MQLPVQTETDDFFNLKFVEQFPPIFNYKLSRDDYPSISLQFIDFKGQRELHVNHNIIMNIIIIIIDSEL